MADESIRATLTIDASAEAIFAVLADPSTHASIDGRGKEGTDPDGAGWVSESLASDPITEVGQIFWMSMYHPNAPDDGNYRTANRIDVFDRPNAIAWSTGYDPGDGVLKFGGWWWRYDLVPVDEGRTEVTLTYDWSGATDEARSLITFPPFPPAMLSDSLAHLAELAR